MAVGKKLKSANKTPDYLVLNSFKICDSSLKGTELEIPAARAIQKPNKIRSRVKPNLFLGLNQVLFTVLSNIFVPTIPRSHGLVVRAVACEARGPGFNSSSDQMVFSLLGYKVVGIKWIQT